MEYTRHPDYRNVLYPERWNMGAASGEASKSPAADVARVAGAAEDVGPQAVNDALLLAERKADRAREMIGEIFHKTPRMDPSIRGTDGPDKSA